MFKAPVTLLQEYCAKKHMAPPDYEIIIEATGFVCRAELEQHNAIGKGKSKRNAKLECAKNLLVKMGIVGMSDSPAITDTAASPKQPHSQHEADMLSSRTMDMVNELGENFVGHEIPLPECSIMQQVGAKTSVSLVQEYCAKNHLTPPNYSIMIEGTGFLCRAELQKHNAIGKGKSKGNAKQECAYNLMIKMGIVGMSHSPAITDTAASPTQHSEHESDALPPRTMDMVNGLGENSVSHEIPLPECSVLQQAGAKTSVSLVQEHCAKNHLTPPNYNIMIDGTGFLCRAELQKHNAIGKGKSKRTAKQECAYNLMVKMGIVGMSDSPAITDTAASPTQQQSEHEADALPPRTMDMVNELGENSVSHEIPLPECSEHNAIGKDESERNAEQECANNLLVETGIVGTGDLPAFIDPVARLSHPSVDEADRFSSCTRDLVKELRDKCVRNDLPLPKFLFTQQAVTPKFICQCKVSTIIRYGVADKKKDAHQQAAKGLLGVLNSIAIVSEENLKSMVSSTTPADADYNAMWIELEKRRRKVVKMYSELDASKSPPSAKAFNFFDQHNYFTYFRDELKKAALELIHSDTRSHEAKVMDLFKILHITPFIEEKVPIPDTDEKGVPVPGARTDNMLYIELNVAIDCAFYGYRDEIYEDILDYFDTMLV